MDEKDGKQPRCGIASCHPKGVQRLASMKVFVANFATASLFQVSLFTYLLGIARTTEKRFTMSSKEMGVIAILNDIVQMILILGVAHFARKTHKPRFLFFSFCVFSVATILLAGPYFVYGPEEVTTTSGHNQSSGIKTQAEMQCNVKNEEKCKSDDSLVINTKKAAFIFWGIASVLYGIGSAGFQTIGLSYIDENVKRENSSVYLAIVIAVIPVAPIIGYMLAAMTLSLPEDLKSSTLSNTEPGFIGAWWLGLIIIPCLVTIFSIWLIFYPKHYPEYYRQKALNSEENDESGKIEKNGCLAVTLAELREFPRSIYRLLKRPEYVSHTLSAVFRLYLVVGLESNMARYLETYFFIPAYKSNMISAITVAVSGLMGNVIGGLILKKAKGRVLESCSVYSATTLLRVIAIIVLMLIKCPDINLSGTPTPEKTEMDLIQTCNSNCSCPQDYYSPYCGQGIDGRNTTFFSLCHAGCSNKWETNQTECSCLSPDGRPPTKGPCVTSCNAIYWYAGVSFIYNLITACNQVPATVLVLRLASQDLRPFAIALTTVAYNLLTFIPGPLIFGALFDQACDVWQKSCGQTGHCLYYNLDKYRLYLHGVSAALLTLSFFSSLVTLFIVRHKKKQGLYDNEDEEEKEAEQTDKDKGGEEMAQGGNDMDIHVNGNLMDGSYGKMVSRTSEI